MLLASFQAGKSCVLIKHKMRRVIVSDHLFYVVGKQRGKVAGGFPIEVVVRGLTRQPTSKNENKQDLSHAESC
jgi:hypothetical protein